MNTGRSTIEREIIERISSNKIRLRFDKVVLRLVDRLQKALNDTISDNQSIIFTVTAPIILPAKTADALECLMRDNSSTGDHYNKIVHGNYVLIRRIKNVHAHAPKVLGFVHNDRSDAGIILDIAETCLAER